MTLSNHAIFVCTAFSSDGMYGLHHLRQLGAMAQVRIVAILVVRGTWTLFCD
jgi:hypothetical protein